MSDQVESKESVLSEILKLKRTFSNRTKGPMGYREIGERLNFTAAGIRYKTKELEHCCPSCLRKLEREKV